MKIKFLLPFLFISLIFLIIFIGFAYIKGKRIIITKLIKTDNIQTDLNKYESNELSLSFSFPSYWGQVREERISNPISELKGQVINIEFVKEETEEIPAISQSYFATPLLQAFSFDYEVFETVLLFTEHYNQNISALEFCQKFINNTLVSSGCQEKRIAGRQAAAAVYAYYIEAGMMGTGKEIFFEKAAFMPLKNNEFPGLEITMEINTITKEGLQNKTQEEIKEIAEIELNKIINNQVSVYTDKKIEEFDSYINSFTFK